MNELDVVSVSCAFAELAFTWGSQVWELMGFVYRSPSHRPWALRAHLGEIVRNAHPFLELGFPARGFSLGQLVLWKQERQGPGCPLAPWSTFVQEVAEGRVPEGQAQVWVDTEYSFSCTGMAVCSYKSVEWLPSLRRLAEYLFSDESLLVLKRMSDG